MKIGCPLTTIRVKSLGIIKFGNLLGDCRMRRIHSYQGICTWLGVANSQIDQACSPMWATPCQSCRKSTWNGRQWLPDVKVVNLLDLMEGGGRWLGV